MTLLLDKRRRAMLREMGVRVWQPEESAAAAPAELAINSGAARAHIHWAEGQKQAENTPFEGSGAGLDAAAPAPPASPRPVTSPVVAPKAAAKPAVDAGAGGSAAWRLGTPHTLYTPDPLAPGARWLVLAETPAASLRDEAFDPLAGDAGKLLGNMLRAAQLPAAALALLVPLARLARPDGAAPEEAALTGALAALVAGAQPQVVLIMGRLAAQAALQTAEPLGRLRGQVHRLHGTAAVVTYDAGYLLRNPLDKAKVWDDLRLAMATARDAA